MSCVSDLLWSMKPWKHACAFEEANTSFSLYFRVLAGKVLPLWGPWANGISTRITVMLDWNQFKAVFGSDRRQKTLPSASPEILKGSYIWIQFLHSHSLPAVLQVLNTQWETFLSVHVSGIRPLTKDPTMDLEAGPYSSAILLNKTQEVVLFIQWPDRNDRPHPGTLLKTQRQP